MQSNRNTFDVIIVGGGLSGLACAVLLTEAGKECCVLEAQDQPGGRIRSVHDKETGAFIADLGPSWVWPAYQPTIAQWLSKLDLETFAQFDQGAAVLDYGDGQPAQTAAIPGQEGNVRVVGGSQALVNALVARLPSDSIRTGAVVSAVDTRGEGVTVIAGAQELWTHKLIMAVPARRALDPITWSQPFPSELREALENTPTWMAPHAKVAVLYEQAFWRDAGLSGRIASRAGPIVEAHDHCGPNGAPAALWGFIGHSPEARARLGEDLEHGIRAQLKRCFGEGCPEPTAVHIEDWATNPFVASAADLTGPMTHPDVGPNVLRALHFDDRVCFAGAETAFRSPGLIEGAFDAAERAAATVLA